MLGKQECIEQSIASICWEWTRENHQVPCWGQTLSYMNEQLRSIVVSIVSITNTIWANLTQRQIHLNDLLSIKNSEQGPAQKYSIDVNSNHHHYCHLNILLIFWCIKHLTPIVQGLLLFIQGFFHIFLVIFLCKSKRSVNFSL